MSDIAIKRGKTFSMSLRWESEPIVYKAITAISQSAPVRITSAAHGLPDGWRVAVTSVKGMTEINAVANSIKDKDYQSATVIDADTIEINNINASGFKPYISGGFLQYNTPVDLTGFTARMKIKEKVGGTVLASTDALDAPLNILALSISTAGHSIALEISATNTAAIAWKKGVFDLEMVSPLGVVTEILTGAVTVSTEVTT